MKVVIPLAGKGTRLRPHTYAEPKPLLRVADKPVLAFMLDDLERLGVDEVVFITGYLGDVIEKWVGDNYPGLDARFVEQKVQDGTAGAVKLAEPYVDRDFLVIFVDTLFDADLSILRGLPADLDGLIWVKEVEDYQRFGVVITDSEGCMERIVEKPKEPISRLASIGLQYIRDWKLLFQGIDAILADKPGAGGEYYLTDAFQYMVDRGARIAIREAAGWYDCGKPETLLATNRHLLETGRAILPVAGKNVRVNEPVRIMAGAELEDVEVGPNVTVGEGCVLRGCSLRDTIVGDRCTIEESRLHDSIMGNDVVVRGVQGRVGLVHNSEVVGGED